MHPPSESWWSPKQGGCVCKSTAISLNNLLRINLILSGCSKKLFMYNIKHKKSQWTQIYQKKNKKKLNNKNKTAIFVYLVNLYHILSKFRIIASNLKIILAAFIIITNFNEKENKYILNICQAKHKKSLFFNCLIKKK